jgi:integrase
VQFRIGGRLVQESFSTQDGAETFGALVDRVGGEAARAVRAKRNVSAAPSLEAFTSSYLDSSSGYLSGVTPGTRDGYRQIAELSFLPFLGNFPVDAITKQDVARWIVWQEAQRSTRYPDRMIAAKTIRNYHGLLSSILTAAADAKLLTDNPARGTRLSRGRRTGVSFLTRSEFQTVLHFIPDHYKPLVLVLAGTGLRWGEATALTWSDLDTGSDPAVLRVDKAWQKGEKNKAILGPPKTARGRRSISLWPDLVEAMGARAAGSDLIFTGSQRVSRVWSARFHAAAWRPAVEAANDAERCTQIGAVPIGKTPRVHDLRHTHASWLIAAGVPLPYVQQRLGHENITTTVDLYGHMLPDMQNATAQAASQAMSGAFKPLMPSSPPLLSN